MNRREALRTLAAGSAAGAMAGGLVALSTPAAEASVDPCLVFMSGWECALEACSRMAADAGGDAEEAFYQANVLPFEVAACDGHVPVATTAAGAAAALRKIIDLDDSEPQDMALIRAALAYLDGAVS